MQTDKERISELEAQVERLERAAYVRPVRGQRYEEDEDGYYNPGCGADDTRDSRGEKLRHRVNEGGEPWWM
jgi:hypothetical protein